ncbi:MAG: hypothetical protein EOP61_01690 [Sphingomonadales bacterium]|nr:MAG: hypothetical protein EOP61_01690 [Sphingomonadales bacterium]
MIFIGLLAMTAQTGPQSVPAFVPPVAGKGQVIFFRRARHSDNIWDTCPVSEGDARILKLKGNRYVAMSVDPGTHRYSAKTEATDKLTLEVEAGERYFVECGLTVGIAVGRPDLRPSSPEEFATYAKHLRPQ